MPLSDIVLILSTIGFMGSFSYYSKEKRSLREFIQQSRRHTYHKNLDRVIQRRVIRYLVLSIAFFIISVPLLIQKFTQFY